MDAPASPGPLKKSSPSGSCTLSLCLIAVYADGLCRQHWVRRQQARRAGTEERGEWKGPVKAYRRRGDVRFVGANVSRRTHRALRVQAKKDGVTLHAMVGLALDEWARKWQLQRSNPDDVDLDRDVVARPDAWSQRPDFDSDNDA